MRIDPTMNKHVGPAPYGGGLQLLPVLLDWVTKPTESGNRRIVVHLSIKAGALIPILDLIEGDMWTTRARRSNARLIFKFQIIYNERESRYI